MMGGCNTRNMQNEEIKWHKILKIVASSWCFHLLIHDVRNHETEMHYLGLCKYTLWRSHNDEIA